MNMDNQEKTNKEQDARVVSEEKSGTEGFQYTYSAKEQAELKRIREKYLPCKENKMEVLRRLDRAVTRKAQIASLVFGIVGILILGLGMSLVMSEFGALLGIEPHVAVLIGISIGIIGGVISAAAYPIHQLILKHEQKKAAPQIIRLADELIK